MRVVVDLNRCQSYGQCVFAAPEVFRFRGAESLEYDHEPDAGSDRAVARAALACPVQAITLGGPAGAVPETAVAGAAVGEPR
ncbi:MAG TPA: ferredoxin [Amycolatopsis sp.]|jgi:ferredoxin